jgi:hypothetical protein
MTVAPPAPPGAGYEPLGSGRPLWPELDHPRPSSSSALIARGLTRTRDGAFARAAGLDPAGPGSDGANAPAGLADTAEWVVVATWPMNQHEEVIGWIAPAARVPEVVIRRRRCR